MTTFVLDPRRCNSNVTPMPSWGSTDVYSVFRVSRFMYRPALRRHSEELLEAMGFSALSEDSFAEDWDSPEDAIYDTL